MATILIAASVPPASPLDGCTALPSGNGAWQYKCEGLIAHAADAPGGGPAANDALQDVVTGLVKGNASRFRTIERRSLGGTVQEVQRVEMPDQHLVAYCTALQRHEGSRTLMCVSSDPKRCAPILELLAARPWNAGPVPGTKTPEVSPLAFAGRTVSVPSGCQGESRPNGGGYVSCPANAFATWGAMPDEASAQSMRDRLERKLLDALRGSSRQIYRTSVPCSLADTETTCWRMQVDPGQPGAFTALSASQRLGNMLWYAACVAPGDSGTAMPCPLVLRPR